MVQLIYVIVAAILAGVGSGIAFMLKTGSRLSKLEEAQKNGVTNLKQIKDDLGDNSRLTMDTGRAVSALAPLVTQHAHTLSKYMDRIDNLSEQLISVKWSVKYLRDTINTLRRKQGLEPIQYPEFDLSSPGPVPPGPPAPEDEEEPEEK